MRVVGACVLACVLAACGAPESEDGSAAVSDGQTDDASATGQSQGQMAAPLIPALFHGTWASSQEDCSNPYSLIRVTGSAINFSELVFEPNEIVSSSGSEITMRGVSRVSGMTQEESVTLVVAPDHQRLRMITPGSEDDGWEEKCPES